MEIKRKHILITIFIYILINSLFYLSVDFLPDESNYLFTTKKMLEGHAPYKDYATDVKPPLNYYFLSIFVYTGTDIIQILRLVAVSINVISSYILFLIARKLFDKKIAICSAVIFLFIFTMPAMSGYAITGDKLSVMFSLASIFYFVDADKKNLAISGIFLGIAALAKQTSLVILGFYFLYYIYLLSRDKKLKNYSSRFLIIVFFIMVPILIVVLHFLSIGALNEMTTWTTKEVLNLRKDDTWIANPAKFTYLETIYTFSIFSPVFFLSFIAFVHFLIKFTKGTIIHNELMLVMLTIPTLYPFILVFRYTTLLLIPLSILSSIALLEFTKSLREKNSPYLKITASLAIGILFLLSVSLNIYSVYKLHTSFSQHEKDQDKIIEYLVNNMEKNQRIYVYGYVPKIYYLSGI
ncbi:MAG: glycosyltransferase family 39 protein, partial [Candidatus Aenigmarchaeota archaeon]|nr:glycosyltransferase family 39 protein [Candidatus Aenigmarchaeota archaeon]